MQISARISAVLWISLTVRRSGAACLLDADADISKGMGRRLSPIAASTIEREKRVVRGLHEVPTCGASGTCNSPPLYASLNTITSSML